MASLALRGVFTSNDPEISDAWRNVVYRILESGYNSDSAYRKVKLIPILEELFNSPTYLHLLLDPFADPAVRCLLSPMTTFSLRKTVAVPVGMRRLKSVEFVGALMLLLRHGNRMERMALYDFLMRTTNTEEKKKQDYTEKRPNVSPTIAGRARKMRLKLLDRIGTFDDKQSLMPMDQGNASQTPNHGRSNHSRPSLHHWIGSRQHGGGGGSCFLLHLVHSFFRHPWANILHNSATTVLLSILLHQTEPGSADDQQRQELPTSEDEQSLLFCVHQFLLIECGLMERIARVFHEPEAVQRTSFGYLGHLMILAKTMLNLQNYSLLVDSLKERTKQLWIQFVETHTTNTHTCQ